MTRLIGREGELEALGACLQATLDGLGQVVLIEGEAGIGKTRLMEEAIELARRARSVVIQGTSEELEASRPFGALARALTTCEAISPSVSELVTAAASGRDPNAPTAQYHVIDELLDHVEELAARAPIVVALDDLQWADPSTLLTVRSLLQRIGDLPVLVVIALRPLPRSRDVDRLIEVLLAANGRHLPLGHLGAEEIHRLVADAVDAEPGASLRSQVHRAGGNPFYLHELLRTLTDEQAIEIRDGRAEVEDGAFPATLGSTILRHLRYLPADTLELLELAAVLGTTFTTIDLAAVTRQGVEQLVGPLRHGIDAEVLHDRETDLAFRHDLVREALYRRLPRAARRELHLAVGRALAGIDAPSARVATHLAVGANPGDADAVDWLRRAAVETTMSAPKVAEDFARRAIELTLPDDPLRSHVRADLVTLLVASGQAAAAHALAHEVLDVDHDPALDGRLRFALGQAAFLLGHQDEAVEQMELAARQPSLTAGQQALALAEVGMARLLGAADLAGAEQDAHEAVAAARSAQDRFAEAMGRCVLAGVEQFRGGVAAAVAAVDAAVALAAGPVELRPGELNSALRDPEMFRGMALLDADRPDEAEAAFRAGSRLSAVRGVAGRGHFYHYWLGLRHVEVGAWDDAVAELHTGLEVAEEIDTRRGAIAAHALLGLIALHRDDLKQATDRIGRSESLFAETGPDFGAEWMLLGRALLLEADGDPDAAKTLLAGAWDMLATLGSRFHYRSLGPDLVRLAIATDDRDRATSVTGALEALASREPIATIRGAALRCRGILQGDTTALLEAVEVLRNGRRPPALAGALEDAAVEVGRDHPGHDDARLLSDEANELYRGWGADRDIARLVARMREVGIRSGVRGPRRRPDVGWESLTPTEHKVVGLVAEGLSNPQIGDRLFISRRTVQTHVSSVFRKLGLTSRVELATEVAHRSDTGPVRDGARVTPPVDAPPSTDAPAPA